MTLVEVVAGFALLAALGVGVLLACGAHQRQIRAARAKLEAVSLADQLLADWHASQMAIPRNVTGQLRGKYRWRWRTRPVRRARLGTLTAEVIRLELVEELFEPSRTAAARAPVLTVELLAPVVQPRIVVQQ